MKNKLVRRVHYVDLLQKKEIQKRAKKEKVTESCIVRIALNYYFEQTSVGRNIG